MQNTKKCKDNEHHILNKSLEREITRKKLTELEKFFFSPYLGMLVLNSCYLQRILVFRIMKIDNAITEHNFAWTIVTHYFDPFSINSLLTQS